MELTLIIYPTTQSVIGRHPRISNYRDFTHLKLISLGVGKKKTHTHIHTQKNGPNVILLMPLAAPCESIINKE